MTRLRRDPRRGVLLPLSACGARRRSIRKRRSGRIRSSRNSTSICCHRCTFQASVGWKDGETPRSRPGLQVKALATGLKNPRSLYVLPNGDILVVETRRARTAPVNRPKEIIMGWLERKAHSAETPGQRHHAAARRRRRRRRGAAHRVPRQAELALRHGPGGQRSLRRRHRCGDALSLQDRRDADHRAGRQAHRPARRGPSTITGRRA